jgi:hypothetical protein
LLAVVVGVHITAVLEVLAAIEHRREHLVVARLLKIN